MTPDERISQIELLLAETMAILDRHTAQLKQHTGLLINLTEVAAQHSDNIRFLLREVSDVKTQQSVMQADLRDLKADMSGVKADVSDLKADMSGVKADVGDLKADMSGVKEQQTTMNGKLDLILEKLSHSEN